MTELVNQSFFYWEEYTEECVVINIKEDRRAKITDAARTLFTDFGYKSVSMEQIAQKAGVAKGTVYLYFKDKNDLFFYLVDELLTEMKNYIETIEAKKLSLFDELHKVIYNLMMFRTSQKFLFRISNEAKELKTPSACSVMNKVESQITGYIEKKLTEAVNQKVIKPCSTSVLAFAMLKLYMALAFEWEETHEPLDEKKIAEYVSLIVKDGLLLK